VLRILSLSDLKPFEIDSSWIGFGLRWGNFPLVLRSRFLVEDEFGSGVGGGGTWAMGSVRPVGRGTGLARRPGTQRYGHIAWAA
jgi:hypothetical protein